MNKQPRSSSDGALSRAGILARLGAAGEGVNILVFDEVDSTNLTVRELALGGAPPGTVVLAAAQRRGRGRLGRSFHSPPGGVYASFLLDSPADARLAPLMTVAASVAVCHAVESVAGVPCDIKWVNDILVGGRKVCGILTEAFPRLDGAGAAHLVVGIGINVNARETDFPPALRGTAGSISLPPGARDHFAAELIRRVFTVCGAFSHGTGAPDEADAARVRIVAEYRARSCVVGREIRVLRGDDVKEAVASDMDDCGRLIVDYPDGTRETLSSGEVSVRVREA